MNSITIGELCRSLAAGQHVLVICKSPYEAKQAATEIYHRYLGPAGGSMIGNTVSSSLGGSVEFGWVETSSGRRLDDFSGTAGSVQDGFSRNSYPAQAKKCCQAS